MTKVYFNLSAPHFPVEEPITSDNYFLFLSGNVKMLAKTYEIIIERMRPGSTLMSLPIAIDKSDIRVVPLTGHGGI